MKYFNLTIALLLFVAFTACSDNAIDQKPGNQLPAGNWGISYTIYLTDATTKAQNDQNPSVSDNGNLVSVVAVSDLSKLFLKLIPTGGQHTNPEASLHYEGNLKSCSTGQYYISHKSDSAIAGTFSFNISDSENKVKSVNGSFKIRRQ